MKRPMSNQDKLDMFSMFEEGMKVKDIMELTGRAEGTVYAYKKIWRAQKDAEAAAQKTQQIPEAQTGLNNSDYAKSYLSGNPDHVMSSFEIKRTVSIRSKKTGILYEMDPSDDKKVVHVAIATDVTFDIELSKFEKFVDEGIDVFLELTRKT